MSNSRSSFTHCGGLMAQREFNVRARRDTVEYGWVTVKAASAEDARRRTRSMTSADVRWNPPRSRWFVEAAFPAEPITDVAGRVLVLSVSMTCGPDPKMLLRLDCGHQTYCDRDLWYPSNPYIECPACMREAAA